MGSPTSWNWNFGDGTNSNQQNPTNIYSSAGNYIVTLTVGNEYGTVSNTATINVLEQSSSSGGSNDNGGSNNDGSSSGGSSSGGSSSGGSSSGGSSSGGSSSSNGGGGGGGGGSPEPQSNVEVKELSQTFITSGKSVKFDFPRNATPVVYVSFDSKKTLGKTTTIAEMLKGKSSLVTELPAGEVYKSFNVWVGNGGVASSKNIENPVLCFKVEKFWLQNKSIDPASIAINRYNDKKWEQFSGNMSGEDSEYLYFTTSVSGFSSFAVTGKNTATETIQPAVVNETQSQPNNESTIVMAEQPPEQKANTSTPGFEIIYGIIGLLVVFLCRRR
jgi:PGF-pre-PGF domain-containing protein